MRNISAIKSRTIKDTSGNSWSSKVLASGSTYYSDPIPFFYTDGFTSLLILTNASVTITYEVSVDKQNWYTPYDIDGTALNSVVTALTADRWIMFSPQIAGYIRFKVVANADATTTITFIEKKRDIKI